MRICKLCFRPSPATGSGSPQRPPKIRVPAGLLYRLQILPYDVDVESAVTAVILAQLETLDLRTRPMLPYRTAPMILMPLPP